MGADWDDESAQWVLKLKGPNGDSETLSANVLISASGLFGTPQLPDIEGIETFAGRMFHTTAWDYQCMLEGNRVALIGTGSSGAQLMPRRRNRQTVDSISTNSQLGG